MAKKARAFKETPQGCDVLTITCTTKRGGIWSCQGRCGGVQHPKFGVVINEKRGTVRFYE